MNQIKVSLSFVLPGRVLLSKQLCLENSKLNNIHSQVVVDDKNKKHTIHFTTRKCQTARYKKNLTKEQYDYMTSAEVPTGAKPSLWKQMNKKQRLEWHIHEIMLAVGGISYDYEIFED